DGTYRWLVRSAGGAFFQLFGLDPADVVAERVDPYDVIHPDDRERVRDVWSRPDLGGVRELEFRVVRRYGGQRWVRGRHRWLPGGSGERRVACVLEDVTRARHREEEIRAARAVAEHADRARADCLTRLGHEVRTTLDAVLGSTRQLEPGRPGAPPTDPSGDAVAHIRRSVEHLLALIGEVDDIARIESGDLAPA